jgi:N-acetylmuramoyl-L-alanine amidase
MSSKTGLNLTKNYSINFSLPKREKKLINFIIIHYTGMKKESDAIKRLCDSKSNVSSHYFIKNNGKLLNLVPDLYEAWHAGKSSWKTFKSLNKYSVGIEIDNPGHYHGYKEYTPKQILSLEKLLRYLMKRYNIKPQNVLGHSDIAPSRKKDPGEKFPWSKLAKKKLCIWHNLDINKIKDFRKVKLDVYQENIFLKNLKKIGYFEKGKSNDKKMNIVKAFQRKFRQKLINGKIDQECLLISKNLLK